LQGIVLKKTPVGQGTGSQPKAIKKM